MMRSIEMTATLQLTPLQRDAMREVANIASGHAATALGELTARRVMIAVPQLTFAPVGDIPALLGYVNQRVVVVAMRVLGDLTGTLVFLMAEHKARELSNLLLSQEILEGSLDELAQSSLMETANIL